MICPNNLNKTILVSYPRSGHHLMVRGLTEALDHKLVYSAFYGVAHNMDNCEFVNLQKSHDFDLTDEINPDLNYIVLIRNFEDATRSWHKSIKSEIPIDEFLESKREYYEGFVKKWGGKFYLINYEDFIQEKIRVVVACCHLIVNDFNFNMGKLRAWSQKEAEKVSELL